MSLEPVPVDPDFPVYGLDRSFTIPRWLNVWKWWQRPGDRLWQVSLGHGDPDGDHVIVTTDAKRPQEEVAHDRPGRHFVGPTSIHSVALASLVDAIPLAFPSGAPNQSSLEKSQALAEVSQLAGNVEAPAWQQSEEVTLVAGEPVGFWVHDVGTVRVAVADLRQVAVGIVARGIPLADVAMEQVNEMLSQYRPLPSE